MARSKMIGGKEFRFVADIDPDRDDDGRFIEDFPHQRYNNRDNLPLHEYGSGPYCKFKIPPNWNDRGVYALVADKDIKYIGKCKDLSMQFNTGYGRIRPRNCYSGGQSTNCRINTLILRTVSSKRKVSLWFHKTPANDMLKKQLLSNLTTEWNIRKI